MDCWTILGINYTADIRAIKRQYALKLKSCHPEEHPETFMELENAYHTAVYFAKNIYKGIDTVLHQASEEHNPDDNISTRKSVMNDFVDSSNLKEKDELDEAFKSIDETVRLELQKKYALSEMFFNDMHNKWLKGKLYKNGVWNEMLNSPLCLSLLSDFNFMRALIAFASQYESESNIIENELKPFFTERRYVWIGTDIEPEINTLMSKFDDTIKGNQQRERSGTIQNTIWVIVVIFILLSSISSALTQCSKPEINPKELMKKVVSIDASR